MCFFKGDWKNCVGKPTLHSFIEMGVEENFVTPYSSSINSFGKCDTTQNIQISRSVIGTGILIFLQFEKIF